jgi:hypothetical protein
MHMAEGTGGNHLSTGSGSGHRSRHGPRPASTGHDHRSGDNVERGAHTGRVLYTSTFSRRQVWPRPRVRSGTIVITMQHHDSCVLRIHAQ